MPKAETIQRILEGTATLDDLSRAKAGFWEKLRAVSLKFPAVREAVALFYFVCDPKISFGLKSTAIIALVYFISPFDIVPDAIPLAGLIDDGMVLMAAITALSGVMAPYREKADQKIRGDKPAGTDGAPATDVADAEVVIPITVQTRAG